MVKNAAKEATRRYIGERPLLFYGVYRLRPGYRRLLVDRTTQLVIEGFPRSGNTFAVVAFEQAQQQSLRIAHHLHAPAQVILAARWRIPSLVLARKPTDAVLSWTIREPWVSVDQALRHYVSFYNNVTECRHAFVVGLFEEVTQSYGAVLERVNAKFGTRFSPFEHSEDNVNSVFARIEKMHRARRNSSVDEKQIARPSALKAELKDALREELETPRVRELTTRAEAAYNNMVSLGHG